MGERRNIFRRAQKMIFLLRYIPQVLSLIFLLVIVAPLF